MTEIAKTTRWSVLRWAVLLVTFIAPPTIAKSPLQGTVWESAALVYDLDPVLLYAIALTESKKRRANKQIAPWPWTFNSPEGSYYAASLEEAEAYLEMLLGKYAPRRIDVGIMQINLGWNGHLVERYEDLLDPEINVRVGAQVLKEALEDTDGDTLLGVGWYHNRSDINRSVWYGTLVLNRYERLRVFFESQG